MKTHLIYCSEYSPCRAIFSYYAIESIPAEVINSTRAYSASRSSPTEPEYRYSAILPEVYCRLNWRGTSLQYSWIREASHLVVAIDCSNFPRPFRLSRCCLFTPIVSTLSLHAAYTNLPYNFLFTYANTLCKHLLLIFHCKRCLKVTSFSSARNL